MNSRKTATSASLPTKVQQLVAQWVNEDPTLDSLTRLAGSVKSSRSLHSAPVRTVGETSSSRDVKSLARKTASPPRGPSPISPAVSPKLSPKIRRKILALSPPEANNIGIDAHRGGAGTRVKLPGLTKAELKKPLERIQHAKPATPSPAAPSESKIPQFYFPNGQPPKDRASAIRLSDVQAIFDAATQDGKRLSKQQFDEVCKVCKLPRYWKGLLFRAVAGGSSKKKVDFGSFTALWRRLTKQYHDGASRFIRLATQLQRDYLVFDDLLPLVQCVVEDHPGLSFLREASEFVTCYISTVICRIFYTVNRSWSGRITAAELRRSNLLSVIEGLEDMSSINEEMNFFSYEHFYVIYCKFFEMDNGRRILDISDLSEYGEYGLTPSVLKRVLSKAVLRFSSKEGVMEYRDFVWFMLSEEDKTSPTSIEYWFRCLDLDGDGVISMYEVEHFYGDQLERMQRSGMEPFSFGDCLCQLLDMVSPKQSEYITLRDLKACGNAKVFFNTLFNFSKFVEHENRDPFAKEVADSENAVSDWRKFARVEYDNMVAGDVDPDQDDGEFDGDGEDPLLAALTTIDDEEESSQ